MIIWVWESCPCNGSQNLPMGSMLQPRNKTTKQMVHQPQFTLSQNLAGKVIATIFWDAKDIWLTEYLPCGQTIFGQCYSNVWTIYELLSLQKGADRSQKISYSKITMTECIPGTCQLAVEHNRLKVLPHPPYSPDLTPSIHLLLPNLKKELSRTHFWLMIPRIAVKR